jgi:dipeptidyl-peptidase-4
MKRLIIIFLLCACIGLLPAESLKKLSIEQVIDYRGGNLFTPLPAVDGWANDHSYYRFKDDKLFLVNAKNGKRSLLFDPQTNKDLEENGFKLQYADDQTPDYDKFLFLKDNRLFLFSRQENKLRVLVEKKENEGDIKNPTLSPGSGKIAYTINGNLYVLDIASKSETRLTADGGEDILNGYASWVYYEEILGRGSRYKAFWWSPDSGKIVFMRFDQSKVPEFVLYCAEGDYGRLETMRYPKAGYPNPTVQLMIADVRTNEASPIPFNDSSDHYLAFPAWNKKSDCIYFQWMNRGQDHIKILKWSLKTQTVDMAYEEKQDAWVEFFEGNDFYLLKNGDFLLRSSKDGWHHIYYIPLQGEPRRLTSGDWSVSGVKGVDEKRKTIFFTAHKEASTETDFYKTGYRGKRITRLTNFKGTHSVTPSPNCRYFIDRYSSLTTPTRMELRDARGKLVRKIADSHSPELDKYHLAAAELFTIETEDGYPLPAIWYLPPGFDKSKKYPVVISIYGGPAASIVANSYGSGYRRGLEKFFLAQEGIITLFIDHRGSGHFGKKAMALMHRQLGKWEMHDFIQAVRYLKSLPFVDGEKIGISGHSYGGYVAAYALTFGADHFSYGISGSPVIDWKLYDSVYTERYMDTPQENPEGYKQSSALTHIEKYKGTLRMTHGTLDDNVHPQNALQFIDKALDTGNTVEFMLYPGSRHGVRGKKRTEYRKSNINFWLKHFFGRKIK